MICEFPQQYDSVVGMEAFIVKHSSLLSHEGDRCTLTSGGAMETLIRRKENSLV